MNLQSKEQELSAISDELLTDLSTEEESVVSGGFLLLGLGLLLGLKKYGCNPCNPCH